CASAFTRFCASASERKPSVIPASRALAASGYCWVRTYTNPYSSFMTWVSYGALSGRASTSFSFSSASGYFLASAASLAAFRGLEAALLTFASGALFSSAARATGLVSPAPRRIALAAVAASILTVSFMLVPELRGVHEPDLLHVVALGSRQHNRDLAILGPAIGTQVNLRLRLLARLRAQILLQSRKLSHHRSVPYDRAVEVHLEVDHLR